MLLLQVSLYIFFLILGSSGDCTCQKNAAICIADFTIAELANCPVPSLLIYNSDRCTYIPAHFKRVVVRKSEATCVCNGIEHLNGDCEFHLKSSSEEEPGNEITVTSIFPTKSAAIFHAKEVSVTDTLATASARNFPRSTKKATVLDMQTTTANAIIGVRRTTGVSSDAKFTTNSKTGDKIIPPFTVATIPNSQQKLEKNRKEKNFRHREKSTLTKNVPAAISNKAQIGFSTVVPAPTSTNSEPKKPPVSLISVMTTELSTKSHPQTVFNEPELHHNLDSSIHQFVNISNDRIVVLRIYNSTVTVCANNVQMTSGENNSTGLANSQKYVDSHAVWIWQIVSGVSSLIAITTSVALVALIRKKISGRGKAKNLSSDIEMLAIQENREPEVMVSSPASLSIPPNLFEVEL